MLVSANLYPWDVDGDPAAADRIAGLGLDGVVLAAAYHGVRAVTPFHPRHRIVTAGPAVYYRAGAACWRGAPLRPAEATPAGSFERAAARLRASGLRVTAWAVLAHGCGTGRGPAGQVRNAYGDSYPWALCAGSPDVRGYAVALAAEVAALGDADEIELEACGWYGFGHGSAHDKTGGPAGGPAAHWLLSACFCAACRDAYGEAGADPDELRAAVRSALDAALGWGAAAAAPAGPASPDDLLPPGLSAALLRARATLAERLLHEVVTAVRAAAPGKQVVVHADPDPRAAGANPGYDPAVLLGPRGADGIVLACWDPAVAGPLVARTAAAAPGTTRIAASLLAVTGLGGRPQTLAEQAAAVRAAGATELRLYHAGLASAGDLAAVSSLLGGPGAPGGPGPRRVPRRAG